MKPIISLYVEMLKDMDITTIKQAQRLVTEDVLRAYRIPLQQHNFKYMKQALAIVKKDKTAPRTKSAIRALSLHQSRQKFLDFIDKRIEGLPEGDPFREAARITRITIAEQMIPLSDADF